MRCYSLLLVVGFLLAASCCKEGISPFQTDENGVVISMPYQWKYALHTSGTNNENGIFYSPIIYNKNIAIPTTGDNGTQIMSMINTSTGKLIWKWNDVYPGTTGSLDIFQHYSYNNLLIWQLYSINNPISYCMSLEDGSTKWRIKRSKLFEIRLHPYIGSSYFTTSYITRLDGYDEHIAYIGDNETGNLTEFLRANLSGEYAAPITENGNIGGISYINVTSNPNLLLVNYSEPLPEWKNRIMFGLYNTEAQEWVYERKQLVEPHWNAGVTHTPVIFSNKVFAAAGNTIVCHDVMTGEQLWKHEFDQDFFFSGFIIEDGMLLANCEDTYLYRINPENGNVEWQTKSAGTSGRMSYLNGVVYYVGGSTGYLHAVDTESGLKTVWRIDARRLGESDGSFTTNAVYCIPGEGGEKGKVIALSGRYAYCFEAYR